MRSPGRVVRFEIGCAVALIALCPSCSPEKTCEPGPLPAPLARFADAIPRDAVVCGPLDDPSKVRLDFASDRDGAFARTVAHLALNGWKVESRDVKPRLELAFLAKGSDRLTLDYSEGSRGRRWFYRFSTIGCNAPAKDGSQCVDGVIVRCEHGIAAGVKDDCRGRGKTCAMGSGPTVACQ